MNAILRLLLIALLLFAAGGCAPDSQSEAEESKPASADAGEMDIPSEGTVIVAILKSKTGTFWQEIIAGLEQAELDQRETIPGLKVVVATPESQAYPELQVDVMDRILKDREAGKIKVDGIILAPLDGNVLIDPVRRAQAAGIPVMILDSPLNYTKDLIGFVGTNNYLGGVYAARHLMNTFPGENCRILVFGMQKGSGSTDDRMAGFVETIRKQKNAEIVHTAFGGADREKCFRNAYNLLNVHAKRVNAIYCVNMDTTEGILLAIYAKNLEGKFTVIGFDSSPIILDGVKNKVLAGVMQQKPNLMGRKSVTGMVRYLKTGVLLNEDHTEVDIRTKLFEEVM